jgi:hypothetical protein
MRKIYVGDDAGIVEGIGDMPPPGSVEELQERLTKMNVMADLVAHSERRAKVVVRENIGTTLYFSSKGDDSFWLSKNADRKERKGDCMIYHFTFKE